MMTRRCLSFMLVAGIALGCSGGGSTGDAGLDASDVPPLVDAAADGADPGCVGCDAAGPDSRDPGRDPGVGPGDTTGDCVDCDATIPDGCPGGALCPCEDNSDCYSGLCVETMDGRVCSSRCGIDISCPEGWVCEEVTAGGEPIFGCLDPMANLCRPCIEDRDCVPARGAGNRAHRCLPGGPEGSFCASGCGNPEICPDGFECESVIAGERTERLCRPVDDACPCTPRFIQRGFQTECYVQNDFGQCTALRTCDIECGARTPQAETCNGIDDDCNGLTDDGTDGAPCDLTNDFGTCVGSITCVAGKPLCSGTAPIAEVCNGRDDNCDGITDEEGAGGCKTYYRDDDRDGYGLTDDARCLCATDAPWDATLGGDCDDTRPDVHPGAMEICNGRDDNCNGRTDEDTLAECFPNVCDSDAGACKDGCDGPEECQAGHACVLGQCRKVVGGICGSDADCALGFCTDGICCDFQCDGTCERCDLAGKVGICSPVPLGQDPDDECPVQEVGTCGFTGVCSGTGSCALWPNGEVCRGAECTAPSTARAIARCNGLGECLLPNPVDCGAFLCDPGTGACLVGCFTDDECSPGNLCVSGTCKRAQGRACGADGDCALGFCTDGFCCQSRCGGICEACNLEDRAGWCDPIPAGSNPASECPTDPVSSCGRTGVCSGARTCALFPDDVVCAAARCETTTVSSPADLCSGNGACVDSGTVDCQPYTCNGTTGLCRGSCTGAGDCASGFACANGVCLRAAGQNCAIDGDCASGFCTDGVCCLNRCGGICERCDLSGRAGFCDPVPQGSDPDDECGVDSTASCGRTGVCSGGRSCALYPLGTVCSSPACVGSVSELADVCNGSGVCVDGGTQACSPYNCDAGTGLCRGMCTQGTDCVTGYECVLGVCLKSRGQTCATDGECAGGFCTDGVCCQARCHGLCEACDQSGRLGFCDPLPVNTDPDNECSQESIESCGRTGECSGSRTCQLYSAGAVCAPAACSSAAISAGADLCNGAGTCVDSGTQDCTPYACQTATGLCRQECSIDLHCASGYGCDLPAGTCRKLDGQSCTNGVECLNGACCSNVCRNLQNDTNHCGQCSRQCTNSNGTTSCVAGTCTPVCQDLWGDCDLNPVNGCEQTLTTLTHCAQCNTGCSRTNANASCATGTCQLTSCLAGYANCDSNDGNGCEVNLQAYSNTCGTAQNLGSKCGDANCGFLCPSANWSNLASSSSRGGRWYRARLTECSDCVADIKARVTLTVPTGADYDLYVYSACGSLWAQSRNGAGVTEQITVSRPDIWGTDDAFDIWIEVRHYSGSACGNWTLSVDGTNC